MLPSEPTQFSWTRYWSPRGQTPTLRDGFLVPPKSTLGWRTQIQESTLSTLPDMEKIPCLVLLGDVGTGKSFEIRTEAERLTTKYPSPDHCTLLLDLKRRSATLIEKEAFSSKEFLGWTEGKHALTLLFDSLDECWRRRRTNIQLNTRGAK